MERVQKGELKVDFSDENFHYKHIYHDLSYKFADKDAPKKHAAVIQAQQCQFSCHLFSFIIIMIVVLCCCAL